jgi:hypothetical protein
LALFNLESWEIKGEPKDNIPLGGYVGSCDSDRTKWGSLDSAHTWFIRPSRQYNLFKRVESRLKSTDTLRRRTAFDCIFALEHQSDFSPFIPVSREPDSRSWNEYVQAYLGRRRAHRDYLSSVDNLNISSALYPSDKGVRDILLQVARFTTCNSEANLYKSKKLKQSLKY